MTGTPIQTLLRALLALCALLISACGGGTEGTGGITINGRLLNLTGDPLAQVLVTDSASGDSDITSDSGDFTILSDLQADITLLFEGGSLNSSVTISDLPEKTRAIRATFRADLASNLIALEQVEIEESNDSNSSTGGSASSASSRDTSPSSASSVVSSSAVSSGTISSAAPPNSGGGSSQSEDSGNASSSASESDSSENEGETSSSQASDSSSSSSSFEEDEGEEIERTGPISALSISQVVVEGISFIPRPDTEYRDKNGQSVGINAFAVGDLVEARGIMRSGQVELERLRKR